MEGGKDRGEGEEARASLAYSSAMPWGVQKIAREETEGRIGVGGREGGDRKRTNRADRGRRAFISHHHPPSFL